MKQYHEGDAMYRLGYKETIVNLPSSRKAGKKKEVEEIKKPARKP